MSREHTDRPVIRDAVHRLPTTIADCTLAQAAWFEACATAAGGSLWSESGVQFSWQRQSRHVMVAFPQALPTEILRAGVARAWELGAATVGVWLDLEAEASAVEALSAVGFERGWQPWWMTVPAADFADGVAGRAASDAMTPGVRLVDAVPEDENEENRMLQPLLDASPPRAWLAIATVDGRSAGRCWTHLAARDAGRPATAGLFDMSVRPRFRRRGIGSALAARAIGASHAAGADRVILNATREGALLYESLGFRHVGRGITWWLQARR